MDEAWHALPVLQSGASGGCYPSVSGSQGARGVPPSAGPGPLPTQIAANVAVLSARKMQAAKTKTTVLTIVNQCSPSCLMAGSSFRGD
jgi:hypothetical protein